MQRPATSTSGSAQSGQLRGNRGATGASLAAAASARRLAAARRRPGRAQTGELGRRPVRPRGHQDQQRHGGEDGDGDREGQGLGRIAGGRREAVAAVPAHAGRRADPDRTGGTGLRVGQDGLESDRLRGNRLRRGHARRRARGGWRAVGGSRRARREAAGGAAGNQGAAASDPWVAIEACTASAAKPAGVAARSSGATPGEPASAANPPVEPASPSATGPRPPVERGSDSCGPRRLDGTLATRARKGSRRASA